MSPQPLLDPEIVENNKKHLHESWETLNIVVIGSSQKKLALKVDVILDIEDTEGEDDENIPYNYLEVYTSKNDLKSVSTEIEKRGYRIDSFEVIKISKEKINISTEERNKIENLVEALEEIDDVNEIWTNIK